MGGFLWNALFLVIAIGTLVTVHEFGHFWVARRCGVKVLRFSVGFGQPLLRWVGKDGTEYQIAAIPLGGYVKMLDEREGEVPPELAEFAFNRKSARARIAIVAAGPLFNFLFAILVYWVMFMAGITAMKPILGDIDPGSIAGRGGLKSGQEIVVVDGREVKTWEDVTFSVLARVGEGGELAVGVRERGYDSIETHTLSLTGWKLEGKEPDPLGSLGITPFEPLIPAILAEVQEGEPGARAGLKVGDRIVSVEGQAVADWAGLVKRFQASPGKTLTFTVERAGTTLELAVTPRVRDPKAAKPEGFLGVRPAVPPGLSELSHTVQFGPLTALERGAERTWDISVLSLKMLGKLVTGAVSMDSISGPISIARGAGATARVGFEYFLSFLGLISINLGLINLLPIPVLDGGHLMYYLIESVRGRPLSERIQEFGLRIGMTLILGLMLVAVYNDLARL